MDKSEKRKHKRHEKTETKDDDDRNDDVTETPPQKIKAKRTIPIRDSDDEEEKPTEPFTRKFKVDKDPFPLQSDPDLIPDDALAAFISSPEAAVPKPDAEPVHTIDTIDNLKQNLPNFFSNLLPLMGQVHLEVGSFKKTGQSLPTLWPHVVCPGFTIGRDLCLWSPPGIVKFPRVYPLGNHERYHPTERFRGTSPITTRYTLNLSATEWNSLYADSNHQDKHVMQFFSMLSAILEKVAVEALMHPDFQAELGMKAISHIDKSKFKKGEEIPIEVIKKHFLEHCVKPVVHLEPIPAEKKDDKPAEAEVAPVFRMGDEEQLVRPRKDHTEFIKFSSKTFQKLFSSTRIQDLKKRAFSDQLLQQYAEQGFERIPLPFYDAGNMQVDSTGRLIPVPEHMAHLETGDVAAVQFKVGLSFGDAKDNRVSLQLQPVGILYFRSGSVGSYADTQRHLTPPKLLPFSKNIAPGYTFKPPENTEPVL